MTMRPVAPFWTPSPETIARAQVTRLIGQAGVMDFDALCTLGRLHPDRYWRAMTQALNIVWSKPPHDYADLSGGAPFPRWFPGGVLNWVDTVFAHDPGRLAVVAENEGGDVERVTYAGLQARVGAFAAGLAAMGLRRGDRIGLLMEMGVEAVVSVLAVSSLGAIAVPLFSGFGAEAVAARLQSADACALIATTGFHRRGRWVDITRVVLAARAHLPGLLHLIVSGDGALPEGAVRWPDVASSTTPQTPARMDPNDPMMVIYTSGTTGKPKGAVHVHGGFPIKIAHDAAVHFDVGAGDVFFWPADLGWVAGTLTIASALMRGATLVCFDGAPDMPDWSRMSRIAAAHGATHLGASPTLIRGLAAHPDQAAAGRPGALRVLITAGEVIDPEHMTWFAGAFGPGALPVINYTGGTEVSGGLLGNVVVRPMVAGAFNAVSPGVDAEVLDEAGQPVRGQVGELAIRAPFVGMTQSFWNDRERYLESYWQQIPGVWVHGDLVLRTAQDVLFVLGRSDDTLKIAGKRVGPAEVEDLLLAMPGIAEAAAIGMADAVKGQSLVVFVVPSAAYQESEAALEAAVAAEIGEQLGKPFRPSRVHVVSQLPRTRSAKVMRRVIRRTYAGQDPGDLSSLEDTAAVEMIRRAALQAAA
jgi:acetyl-CoA synthetase